jgi:hypothetical protein
MPISNSSAPAVVASAAKIGSRAARSPPKMKNSAISKIGNAISSPRNKSFWEAAIPSRLTARSPPTCTCAPGTVPWAAERIASTAMCWAVMDAFLRTETTIRLACPSLARSRGSGLV